MKLGVVIPTNRGADNVDRLLRSFERGERIPDEIVIVDNGAITSDYNYDGILPNVNVVSLGARHNLSAARNAGAKLISADILMLVDDDNVADRSLCSRLMKVFEGDPQVHAAGPLMRYLGSGKIWCAGIQRTSLTGRTLYIGQGEDYWDESWPNYSCELPNCIALRRDAFNAIGGFDSHLFPIHFEDADFAARLMEKFGSGFLIEPQAVVYHDTGDQMTVGSALLRSMERGGCARVRGTSRNRILYYGCHSQSRRDALVILGGIPIWAALVSADVMHQPSTWRNKARTVAELWVGLVQGYARLLAIWTVRVRPHRVPV